MWRGEGEGDYSDSESASAGQCSLAAGQTVTAVQTAAGGNISLMSRHTELRLPAAPSTVQCPVCDGSAI